MRGVGLTILALALGGCATASSRCRPSPPPVSTDWRVLQRLTPGAEIAVDVNGAIRRGRFDSVTAAHLMLREPDRVIQLRREDVVRVFQRIVLNKTSRPLNMLWGALAWTMMGGFVSLWLPDHQEAKAAGTLAVLGAAEGAFLPTRTYRDQAIFVRGRTR